jgi:hypothetical protein
MLEKAIGLFSLRDSDNNVGAYISITDCATLQVGAHDCSADC